jgi:hypothetical protein
LFTNLNDTIRATLLFNDRGELTNFAADGRAAASADGKSFTKMRIGAAICGGQLL